MQMHVLLIHQTSLDDISYHLIFRDIVSEYERRVLRAANNQSTETSEDARLVVASLVPDYISLDFEITDKKWHGKWTNTRISLPFFSDVFFIAEVYYVRSVANQEEGGMR